MENSNKKSERDCASFFFFFYSKFHHAQGPVATPDRALREGVVYMEKRER